ncbi:MAG: leucine-rich repeat domain-containing protein [Blautia sp.]|nr:leucine-rich repeat domain-containing protein [Blautia sp.]
MFEYIVMDSSEILITKYTGDEARVEVPGHIEGHAVTGIGDYAFSQTAITHLSLPESLRRLGRYALYQCHSLCELSFYGGLTDFGAGAFTGCHRIRQLNVDLGEDETSALREVLMEVSEELTLVYRCHGMTALLMFPEYYEEGVENTPARIIEHHTHGSGLFYRNCFIHRKLQFPEYDKRFPYAIGQEKESFLLRLVTGRLRYPYSLTEEYRLVYESYLSEHFDKALDLFHRQQDTACIGFLMDFHHRRNKKSRPAFDL